MAKKIAKKEQAPLEQYDHKGKDRVNNPPVGLVTAHSDNGGFRQRRYEYDPHIDPRLEWSGKTEHTAFDVHTVSLHVHERIDPRRIVEELRKAPAQHAAPSLFEEDVKPLREAVEFYKHRENWSNRLVAGDSLLVMNSLLEKEAMAGKVQMVYFDPPYGIKYGSNFQPFVNKRDVKDGSDADLTAEPEMIKAFRDTWELGIHSYLTYIRDRLLLARELLHDSGSVFVQISDENVHRVRCIMDEVFGAENFVSIITFTKTVGQSTNLLPSICDYIVWYAKEKDKAKSRKVYHFKEIGGAGATGFTLLESPDKTTFRSLTKEEIANPKNIPQDWEVFDAQPLVSQGWIDSLGYEFEFNDETFLPPPNRHWTTTKQNMLRLASIGRLVKTGRTLQYKKYLKDFPVTEVGNVWIGLGERGFTGEKIYVVQTAAEAIKRCLIMSTDPGDLVLDITCGSGTTAFVAENWGRRWVTCDTSRVALTLAKQRLMTAKFDYFELAHPTEGVDSGFRYKTVPHITLKSIANNEEAPEETLYDQPYIDNKRLRITGPFTVEAVPAPTAVGADLCVRPLGDEVGRGGPACPPIGDATHFGQTHRSAPTSPHRSGETLRHSDWKDELLRTGVRGKGGQRIEFCRVESLTGTRYLQAEAETKESDPKRVLICFGPEHAPLEQRTVELAIEEAGQIKPAPQIVLFCAFQFDEEAAKDIDETNWRGVTLLKAQMNADLLTDDLKKKRASNDSFWLIGQPDVKVTNLSPLLQVEVLGFDYYDPKRGDVISGGAGDIAMWMLDTDYDGRSLYPTQVFFPMSGAKDGWSALAKNLKAELDEEKLEAFRGTVSLPFTPGKAVAVKIIDARGIESLKIFREW